MKTIRTGRTVFLATTCGLALLAACGGNGGGGDPGGGGGGGGGGATTFNLSGTIAIAETAAVDSDTNDVNQSGYVPNDTAGTAQALTAPVLLVGSVNQPNTGPRGRNNDGSATLGDEDDVFRVDLVAGQVVELEFASDPAASDVDLYIYNAGAALVGVSNGVDTRFECVTVTRSGSYFVLVNAFRNASIYNLRIGAPGTSANCPQSTMAEGFVAGEVLLEPRRASGATAPVGSPANCAGAIAVSATDARRGIAHYSNTGATIRVAAPGGDTSVSTTGNGAPDGVYSAVATFDAAGRRQPAIGPMQGTSMASPHVAGVMALMRFVNPGLTVTQVDNLLAAGSLTDDLGVAGRDNTFGFGLINARKAVDAALAALSAPPAQPPAQIVALPSSLDFGALQTSAVVELSLPGPGTETFTGAPQVVLPAGMNPGSVTVAATAVGAGGLGRYTITVDRSGIPAPGTYYPTVRFTLSSARVLTVQLAINKQAAGPGAGTARGNFGPVYVLLIDPATGTVDHTVLATFANGRYTWSKTGYAKTRVQIVAGGDTDNDDLICARGETCGAFPVLAPGQDITIVELTGDRTDLNFQVAPLSGMSPSGADGAAGPRGWRRTAGP